MRLNSSGPPDDGESHHWVNLPDRKRRHLIFAIRLILYDKMPIL
jgi:hypothetical protein